MIRTVTMMSLVALLAGGCGGNGDNGDGGGGSGGTGGGMDLSASASNDLSGTLPADMQPAYGCHAYAACRATCTDQTTCTACAQSATAQARSLYQTLTRCERRECFPVPDGGPAPCNQGGGTPSAQCTTCLADVIKATGTCGADTMYCGTCHMAYAACQADLP